MTSQFKGNGNNNKRLEQLGNNYRVRDQGFYVDIVTETICDRIDSLLVGLKARAVVVAHHAVSRLDDA